MKKTIIALAFALLSLGAFAQKTELVNPLVGTDLHGHTYPGAVAPFGMVQLSPDTRLNGWDGCSCYHYTDSILYGFSHTHLSGTGCEDLGDFLFTPTVLGKNAKDYTLKFSHKDEYAVAGYYRVKAKNKEFITTELTATRRGGWHKYTFPKKGIEALVINMDHRDKTLDWNVEIKDSKTVLGYRCSQSWNDDQKIYFAAQFSKEIVASQLDKKTGKLYLYFGESTKKDNTLEALVTLSSVSKEGALKNLQAEECKDFASAKEVSNQMWEKALSIIEIEGGTKAQQRTFYTSLYHCMIAPNLYSDVDGRYRGMVNNAIEDGRRENNIFTADGYERYTIFSLWDTYRALNPLLTIIKPTLCKDFANTFIDYYRQTNELPMWELHSWETYCMIGIHGVSVLAEWYRKGIRVDDNTTLSAMLATANMDKLGLPYFNKYGYISSEKEHESVSKTVEFAYNMYCIAMTAKAMGRTDVYNEYIKRAQYYKNLFNPENKFIQPKENGRFLPNFDPKQIDINYTEGNGWHYTFYVPQDVNTLIDMMGGDKGFFNKLEECFTSKDKTTGRDQADCTGLIGQYAHGNEPSQHTAYLYNYVGAPYRTQELVREILNTLYSDKPDGVCGNDDCGQMAAWYVMSAMGFYAVSPVSGEYIIGSPLFDKVTINLENGKKFVIESKQGKNTPYVTAMKLNGKDYTKTYITHEDIMAGGTLCMTMSDKADRNFGSKEEDRPHARITDNLITVSPYLNYEGTGTFTGSLDVKVNTWDGSIANIAPSVKINETSTLDFFSTGDNGSSKHFQSVFYKIPEGRTIKILTPYSPQYTAGGDNALIDRKRGDNNWRLGCWQGYWGENVEAIIDLGSKQKVNKIGGEFIQDQKAWIFMPTKVEYYVSDDGVNFKLLETVNNPVDERDTKIAPHIFYTNTPCETRYIKMKAYNRMTNPSWHLSAGEKSWLFTDEIDIQ